VEKVPCLGALDRKYNIVCVNFDVFAYNAKHLQIVPIIGPIKLLMDCHSQLSTSVNWTVLISVALSIIAAEIELCIN